MTKVNSFEYKSGNQKLRGFNSPDEKQFFQPFWCTQLLVSGAAWLNFYAPSYPSNFQLQKLRQQVHEKSLPHAGAMPPYGGFR